MKHYRIAGVPVPSTANWSVPDESRFAIRDAFDLLLDSSQVNDQGKSAQSRSPWHHVSQTPRKFCNRHRVEKLLVVDNQYTLKGLITVKDIQKKLKYPNARQRSTGLARGSCRGSTGTFPGGLKELFAKKWT